MALGFTGLSRPAQREVEEGAEAADDDGGMIVWILD
jgi:hypothetical protein